MNIDSLDHLSFVYVKLSSRQVTELHIDPIDHPSFAYARLSSQQVTVSSYRVMIKNYAFYMKWRTWEFLELEKDRASTSGTLLLQYCTNLAMVKWSCSAVADPSSFRIDFLLQCKTKALDDTPAHKTGDQL